MKGTIRVMDGTGDTPITYDTEDTERMAEVNAEFDRLVASGAMIYDKTSEAQIHRPGFHRSTRDILENTEELLVVPPHVGG